MTDAALLRFLGDTEATLAEVGWTGPWPPPERMVIATGRETGALQVTDPARIAEARQKHADFDEAIEVQTFIRSGYSRIPAEAARNSAHVMRGATYVPEGS